MIIYGTLSCYWLLQAPGGQYVSMYIPRMELIPAHGCLVQRKYRAIYDTQFCCHWLLQAPDGQYASIYSPKVDLVPAEQTWVVSVVT